MAVDFEELSRRLASGTVVLLLAASLSSCAGNRTSNLGVSGERLAPCPSSPNCVSSDATDESQRVAPLPLLKPAARGWRIARERVAHLPRTRIVAESSSYLHAECRSLFFRFVDDLELQLRASDGVIAVRSASRVGRSDLGVNRRRVETLREFLAERQE